MLKSPLFAIQILIICTLIWTLRRSEILEPLVQAENESQIHPTITNILYDCSAQTAKKGNHTTGGEYLGIFFPTFSLLSRGTVLLEPSTTACLDFELNEDTRFNEPQNICYLNLARNCENSVYWNNYKISRKLRRKLLKKSLKRNTLEELSILEALEREIWKIKALRKASPVSFGLFPIQLALQGILLASKFLSYYWPLDAPYSLDCTTNFATSPPSSSPTPSPIEETKLPVTLVAGDSDPCFIQIFVKFQDNDGRTLTKTATIRNKGNLLDLETSIHLIFPQLLHVDYYLTLNGKIINDNTLLFFQDLAFKTIEVQMRLKGGMMQPDDKPPNEMNILMQMMIDIKKQLELSLITNEKLQQRIEKLEDMKKLKEIEEELDRALDTSDEDPFTTPSRPKQPQFTFDEVQRTPFIKKSKSMIGKSTEVSSNTTGAKPVDTSSISTPSGPHTTATTSTTPSTSSPLMSPSGEYTSKKSRGFKPVTNADLKIYQVGSSWEAWYRRFQLLANSCCWSDGERIATLCHFMPEEIKEFLENLSADSFKDCRTLSKILEDLFDLYEKTEEEREKEFLNITCKPKESVATYYLRFRNLATLAKESRSDKLMKYFANSLRPLQLHQKVIEKMHKCSTLAEVYQLALLEEKELARLRKLRNEEKEQKKGVRKFELSKPEREDTKETTKKKVINPSTKKEVPLMKQSTNWLVNNHRCAYCTKPIDDANSPHKFEDCKAKYPFYRAKEVRELAQAKKDIPARSAWPEDPRRTNTNTDAAASNLKGQAGLNL